MPHNLKEFRFDRYRLDVAGRCLFRDGELISLTGKEFVMLQFLLESGGRLVTKEELFGRVWPDTAVEESNLFQHIRSLRRKLGDRQDGGEFIKNIHGRGYCFVAGDAVAEEIPPESSALAAAPAQEPASKTPSRWVAVAVFTVTLALLATFLYRSRAHATIRSEPEKWKSPNVIDSPTVGTSPRIVRTLRVGARPVAALLTADGKRLFVAESGNQAVCLIDAASGALIKRFFVRPEPFILASGLDGARIYVAHMSAGLSVIDTATNRVRRVAGVHDSIRDLVVTPDGKSAYLAMGFLGLGKVDLQSEQFSIVSRTIYVEGLALGRDGRYLYVSYQAGGPGGSPGHDAIGYFDTRSDRLAGVITGLSNVGGFMAVSNDGSQLIEDGGDACEASQYDHNGCPFVPGGILNLVDIRTNKLVRSVGTRSMLPRSFAFSKDGQYLMVATTDNLLLMSPLDLRLLGSLPILTSGRIAFTADGSLAYVPAMTTSSVAVVEMSVRIRAFQLANRGDTPATFPLAIVSSSDFDARAVDPTTLRLGGRMVERGEKGTLMASIETVTGFDRYCLVVHFSSKAAKGASSMSIEGFTYAGMPVRGVVDRIQTEP